MNGRCSCTVGAAPLDKRSVVQRTGLRGTSCDAGGYRRDGTRSTNERRRALWQGERACGRRASVRRDDNSQLQLRTSNCEHHHPHHPRCVRTTTSAEGGLAGTGADDRAADRCSAAHTSKDVARGVLRAGDLPHTGDGDVKCGWHGMVDHRHVPARQASFPDAWRYTVSDEREFILPICSIARG